MIERVIAACLAAGACHDFKLLCDPVEVSAMSCMIAGQPEVARRNASDPRRTVRRRSRGLRDARRTRS